MEFTTTARDMTVYLEERVFPDIDVAPYVIRRAEKADYKQLEEYVKEEFGERWIQSVKNGFKYSTIPIYLAFDDNKLIGFACFNASKNKKGLFGPMGTSMTIRRQGVGKALLYHCLRDLTQLRYDYAIISEAGPLEFYEKTCDARLIPVHKYKISREGT